VNVGDPPHSTLVKGEHKIYQPPIHMLKTDYNASGSDLMHDSGDRGYQHRGSYKYFRMPRMDFPKFDGEHPRLWEKNVRNTSGCVLFLRICGPLLLPCIFMVMQHIGFKHLKLSIQIIIGWSYV
jgi:hypothetical protein